MAYLGKQRRSPAASWVTAGAVALAVVSALVLGSAGVGYRSGWWGLGPAFGILRSSVYVGAAAFLVALIGLAMAIAGRSSLRAAAAVLAGLVAAGAMAVPLAMQRTARSVPPIHDISTDTASPPEFVALRPVRERAPNGAAPASPEVAAQQRAGYPELGSLRLPIPPDRAFARAEAAARRLGWDVAAAVPAEGRIEATATTRWFGFKDDVVVRVTPAPGGSQVDVRSASRIGRSDLGANAARIRAFLDALRAA